MPLRRRPFHPEPFWVVVTCSAAAGRAFSKTTKCPASARSKGSWAWALGWMTLDTSLSVYISFLLCKMRCKRCMKWACKRRQPVDVSRACLLQKAPLLKEPPPERPPGTRRARWPSRSSGRRRRCLVPVDETQEAELGARPARSLGVCVNGVALAQTSVEPAGAGPCACAKGAGPPPRQKSRAGGRCEEAPPTLGGHASPGAVCTRPGFPPSCSRPPWRRAPAPMSASRGSLPRVGQLAGAGGWG